MPAKKNMLLLLSVVLLNYVAQVPYYLHQYYIPHHLMPSPVGTLLLAATLVWFLVGYLRFMHGKRYGWGLLLAFLVAQVLFYGHALVLGLLQNGGAVAQLKTHSPFLFVIFLIGYINFAVAAYYLVWLSRHKSPKAA